MRPKKKKEKEEEEEEEEEMDDADDTYAGMDFARSVRLKHFNLSYRHQRQPPYTLCLPSFPIFTSFLPPALLVRFSERPSRSSSDQKRGRKGKMRAAMRRRREKRKMVRGREGMIRKHS